jgi:thioredoxin 1
MVLGTGYSGPRTRDSELRTQNPAGDIMTDQSLPKSFDDLIRQSALPVLVDFWAEWCGACKMMAPTIDKIAAEFKGKMTVVKINVDKKGRVASEYRITAIPTIILFDRGEELMRKSGALPFEALKSEIDARLGRRAS